MTSIPLKAESLEDAFLIADHWQRSNKAWHFHMLTPSCVFNERRDVHAIVLENRTDNESVVVYTESRNLLAGRIFADLVHGHVLSGQEPKSCDDIATDLCPILSRARQLNEQGTTWHHHMFFPDCRFNEHAPLWVIVFEDPERTTIQKVTYKDEPIADFRAIELLYWAQSA